MTTKVQVKNIAGPGKVSVGVWTDKEGEDWNEVMVLNPGDTYEDYLYEGQSLTVIEVTDD